jgi:WD40 repeat protein
MEISIFQNPSSSNRTKLQLHHTISNWIFHNPFPVFWLIPLLLILASCTNYTSATPAPTIPVPTKTTEPSSTPLPTLTQTPTPIPEYVAITSENFQSLSLIKQQYIDTHLVAVSPTEDYLITGDKKGYISLLSLPVLDVQNNFGYEGTIVDWAISPDGLFLATNYRERPAYIWDLSKPGSIHGQTIGAGSWEIGFNPTENIVAFHEGGHNDYVVFYDLSNDNVYFGHFLARLGNYLIFSPNLKYMADYVPEGHATYIEIFDVAAQKVSCWARQDHEGLVSVTFSPNEDMLVAYDSYGNGKIKFWNPVYCTLLDVADWNNGPILDIHFSPDQSTLFIINTNDELFAWQINNNTILYSIQNVGGVSAYFSLDGKFAVFPSSDFDKSFVVEVATGATFILEGKPIGFSHDGKYLVTFLMSSPSEGMIEIYGVVK